MSEEWKSGISPQMKEKIRPSVRLEHLKEAFEAQKVLQSRIDRMMGERLTDLSLIPRLYEEYNRIAEEHGFRGDLRNGNHKQFLMVLLLLYCPECVFGGRISRPFRNAVSSVIHLKSSHIVYSMRDKSAVWYRNYKTFAVEVDLAYEGISAEKFDKIG